MLVEQVIHLKRQPEPFPEIVMGAEVGDGIAGGNSRTEIIYAIGLICVVLVAARIRTRYGDFIEVEHELRSSLDVHISLSGLLGNQGNPIAGVNVDIAIESGIAGKRGIA